MKGGNKDLRITKRILALGRLISMEGKVSKQGKEIMNAQVLRTWVTQRAVYVMRERGVNPIKTLDLHKGQGRSC